MGLLGALVGGSIGLLIGGGPIGAVIGGILGYKVSDEIPGSLGGRQGQHLVGRCSSCKKVVSFQMGEALVCPHCGTQLSTRPGAGAGVAGDGMAGDGPGSARQTAEGTAQSAFLVALISLAAKVAKADGRVTSEEIAAFDRFLARDLGMPASERRLAAEIFNEARDSAMPTADYARQVRSILGGHRDRMLDLVSLLLKVAWADGKLNPAEEGMIQTIARDLGLRDRDYQEAKAMLMRNVPTAAFAVLGLEPTATNEEIKRSYRRLAREYHPDMLAAKGLSEDFTRFANEKIQVINEAYELLRKERGF